MIFFLLYPSTSRWKLHNTVRLQAYSLRLDIKVIMDMQVSGHGPLEMSEETEYNLENLGWIS